MVKLYRNKINYLGKKTEHKTLLGSDLITLKNSKKPKYKDFLYKRNVSKDEIVSKKNKKHYLNFKNYLTIVYLKESEEENYLIGMFGKRKKSIRCTKF